MARQVVSRTQRRMEKRHALIMLAVLVVACLVSFSLGVMVGKGGGGDDLVVEQMPQQKPARVTSDGTGKSAETPPAEGSGTEALTFYDTLPQGEGNAMGSGINLPPEEGKNRKEVPDKLASRRPSQKTVTLAADKAAEVPAAVEPVAEKTLPQPKPAVQKPAATASGTYIIQVASTKDRQGAESLRDRMSTKGYPAFVEQADLGEKGIWHRVFAGPYGNKADADKTIAALKNDKISSAPLLKKR